jgi:hypothetical protein
MANPDNSILANQHSLRSLKTQFSEQTFRGKAWLFNVIKPIWQF